MDLKEQVRLQFGANASSYVDSPLHAKGDDLQLLKAWVQQEQPAAALDIATGAGHASLVLAEQAGELTALDLTPEMLKAAEGLLSSRGCTNVRYVQGDAEALSFADEAFDLVACRVAAHHFPNPDGFVRETARVLKAGGSFLLLDNVAPEADEPDALYNEIEKRRDPSHYRAWKKTEWIRRVEQAGMKVDQLVQTRKTFLFDSWCRRMNVPDAVRQELEAYMLGWPQPLREQLSVVVEQERIASFQGDYMMLKARKL